MTLSHNFPADAANVVDIDDPSHRAAPMTSRSSTLRSSIRAAPQVVALEMQQIEGEIGEAHLADAQRSASLPRQMDHAVLVGNGGFAVDDHCGSPASARGLGELRGAS